MILTSESIYDAVKEQAVSLYSITYKKESSHGIRVHLIKTTNIINDIVKTLHQEDWKDVEKQLPKLEVFFDFFEDLYNAISTKDYLAEPFVPQLIMTIEAFIYLKVAMEDHVLNGKIDEQLKSANEDATYNPEFVEMVKNAADSKTRIKVNPANLWDSLK